MGVGREMGVVGGEKEGRQAGLYNLVRCERPEADNRTDYASQVASALIPALGRIGACLLSPILNYLTAIVHYQSFSQLWDPLSLCSTASTQVLAATGDSQNLMATKLYTPENNGDSTSSAKLRRSISEKHALNLTDYQQLYQWSCHRPDLFWHHVWQHPPQIVADSEPLESQVVDRNASPDQNPPWFPTTTLNWAENMLEGHRTSGDTALIQARKCSHL